MLLVQSRKVANTDYINIFNVVFSNAEEKQGQEPSPLQFKLHL